MPKILGGKPKPNSVTLIPNRLAVMGDSAGGCMSAVVSQQAKLAGLALPALQVLIYPTTDAALAHPSVQTLGQGFGLDIPLLTWFRGHFVQDPAVIEDYRVSPLRNPDLTGLPEAIVITATDPLRDEGLKFYQILGSAGVSVYSRTVNGTSHVGDMCYPKVLPEAFAATIRDIKGFADSL